MSATLSIVDLLETARRKLRGLSALLNDSKKFAHAANDFDGWLNAHSQQLSSNSELDQNTREQVVDILRQLTRLELQARHNSNLVADMQSYLLEGNSADNYLPKAVASVSKNLDTISSDEKAAVGVPADGAPDTSEPPDPALTESAPSGLALGTPVAQIYAKQNEAIHQANQE